MLLIPAPPGWDVPLASAWTLQGAALAAGAPWHVASGGRTPSDRMTGTRVVYDLPAAK